MKIPSRVYDILKWILLIVVDAFVTVFMLLANTRGWDIPTEAIVTTITGISTFVGSCVGISTKSYYNDQKEGE